MIETYEQIEQRLYRQGGEPWKRYRREKERFIEKHVGATHCSRREAQTEWSIYFMGGPCDEY